MKKSFTFIGVFVFLSTLTINAQTISYSELKKSANKSSSGAFAELLISKGYTFLTKETRDHGGFYSRFATDFRSFDNSWSSRITIYSYNGVEFIFTDLTKANYNTLLNQIKVNCEKECFKYSDILNNYYTSYHASDSIKFFVYTEKGVNGFSDTNHIWVIKRFSPSEHDNANLPDRYNNSYWFYFCDMTKSK